MQKRWAERSFLEEKLRRVKKALKQLKKDRKITGFLPMGQFSFARTKKMKRGINFYVAFVNGAKYLGRPLSIGRNIKISLFDSQSSIERKILETIKRL